MLLQLLEHARLHAYCQIPCIFPDVRMIQMPEVVPDHELKVRKAGPRWAGERGAMQSTSTALPTGVLHAAKPGDVSADTTALMPLPLSHPFPEDGGAHVREPGEVSADTTVLMPLPLRPPSPEDGGAAEHGKVRHLAFCARVHAYTKLSPMCRPVDLCAWLCGHGRDWCTRPWSHLIYAFGCHQWSSWPVGQSLSEGARATRNSKARDHNLLSTAALPETTCHAMCPSTTQVVGGTVHHAYESSAHPNIHALHYM